MRINDNRLAVAHGPLIPTPPKPSPDIFTIDVEDWFNVSGRGEPNPDQWDGLPSRVEENLHRLFDMLDREGAKATCFFVGYFARRFPHLVREAVTRGHEVASHSFYHRIVSRMTEEELFQDARDSRLLLEDVGGKAVLGYRAPAFSIGAKTPWFFERLAEAGYRYDSSVFPALHAVGRMEATRLGPYSVDTGHGRIDEYPISAVQLMGKPMCFFGGGYLRLFPWSVISTMAKVVKGQGRPVIFYVHPREIDASHPRVSMPLKARMKTYINMGTTEGKILNALQTFRTTSFERYRRAAGVVSDVTLDVHADSGSLSVSAAASY
jgi:polysaccharide deacetylase family protein (PEP-CTERM system associated)